MENIKDFLLKTNEVEHEEKAKVSAKKKASKPSVEYSTVFVSGPDFAIRRKTKTTSSVFVYILSADQIYIKNEKNGDIVSDIKEEDLVKFFSALPDEGYVFGKERPNFTNTIKRGKGYAESLLAFREYAFLREFAKHGLLYYETLPESFRANHELYSDEIGHRSVTNQIIEICKAMEQRLSREEIVKKLSYFVSSGSTSDDVYKLFYYAFSALDGYNLAMSDGRTAHDISIFTLLEDRYGLDGVRKYIAALLDSPSQLIPAHPRLAYMFYEIIGDDSYYRRRERQVDTIPRVFELDRFIEYSTCQSYAEGFRSPNDLDNFFLEWNDDLRMQKLVYGKIRDKYPDNLLTHHQIMSAKCAILQERIDEEKWNSAREEMKKYEYSSTDLMIVSPKSREDMVDEAQQQSNCLASYVSSVADGFCMIFFLRRKSDPEASYVTIEIRHDLSLGQVKARFNREPDEKAKTFVNKWYNKMFVENTNVA